MLYAHVGVRHLKFLPQFGSYRAEILHIDSYSLAGTHKKVCMQNFNPLASKLREEREVTTMHMLMEGPAFFNFQTMYIFYQLKFIICYKLKITIKYIVDCLFFKV